MWISLVGYERVSTRYQSFSYVHPSHAPPDTPPFTQANNSIKNGCLRSADELPTSSGLRFVQGTHTFLRRMLGRRPVSPWAVPCIKFLFEQPIQKPTPQTGNIFELKIVTALSTGWSMSSMMTTKPWNTKITSS